WCCALFFFFSSRRRHTRFSRDWSSDVCSSDLEVDHPRRADRDLPGWFRRTDGQRPEEVLGRTHAPTLRTRAVPGPTPRRPDRRRGQQPRSVIGGPVAEEALPTPSVAVADHVSAACWPEVIGAPSTCSVACQVPPPTGWNVRAPDVPPPLQLPVTLATPEGSVARTDRIAVVSTSQNSQTCSWMVDGLATSSDSTGPAVSGGGAVVPGGAVVAGPAVVGPGVGAGDPPPLPGVPPPGLPPPGSSPGSPRATVVVGRVGPAGAASVVVDTGGPAAGGVGGPAPRAGGADERPPGGPPAAWTASGAAARRPRPAWRTPRTTSAPAAAARAAATTLPRPGVRGRSAAARPSAAPTASPGTSTPRSTAPTPAPSEPAPASPTARPAASPTARPATSPTARPATSPRDAASPIAASAASPTGVAGVAARPLPAATTTGAPSPATAAATAPPRRSGSAASRAAP